MSERIIRNDDDVRDERRLPDEGADGRHDDRGDGEHTAARVDGRHDDRGDGEHTAERRIDRDPSSERVGPTNGPGGTADGDGGLLDSSDRNNYQRRWDDIQVRFIDEPRQSVREADDLVSDVTGQIATRFSNARKDMEQRWEDGNDPTTEELRRAVQRYRDFFQRLVAQ